MTVHGEIVLAAFDEAPILAQSRVAALTGIPPGEVLDGLVELNELGIVGWWADAVNPELWELTSYGARVLAAGRA